MRFCALDLPVKVAIYESGLVNICFNAFLIIQKIYKVFFSKKRITTNKSTTFKTFMFYSTLKQ